MTGRVSRRLLVGLLLLLFALSGHAVDSSTSPNTGARTLTILHTNDTHAHTLPDKSGVGGYAVVASFLKQTRAGRSDVLVLDAGDMITGSPVSTLYQGLPIFDILNTLPIDCAVLGNHEFDHGWEKIAGFRRVARFPILCANIFSPTGELLGDAPATLFTVNGIRVGVIGVTAPDLYALTAARGHRGLRVQDQVEAVTERLPELRSKCDLVVVLSHCGLVQDIRLAEAVPDVDVIVGGHSHTELDQPRVVGHTIIVQAKCYTEYAGRLDLEVDVAARRVTRFHEQLVKMDRHVFHPDPATQKVVDKYERDLKKTLDAVIGKNDQALDKAAIVAAFEMIFAGKYGADFGYYQPGGVRATLPAGRIARRDVYQMLPFDNAMVVVTVSSDELASLFGQRAPEGKAGPFTVATVDFYADRMVESGKLREEQVKRYPAQARAVVMEHVQRTGGL